MKEFRDYKEVIHKCSKCGLCQAACPIYGVTGNDCSVSRGQFIMLSGVIDGKFPITSKINRYLNLCLKCGACSKFCPSGIDVVDVIAAAKHEYLKAHRLERLLALFRRTVIFGLMPKLSSLIVHRTKSKTFDKKVLFFGGCGSKVFGDKNTVQILNSADIEVINPNFDCCGIFSYTSGDFEGFEKSVDNFVKTVKKYNIKDIVTSCASCEKTIKNYIKYAKDEETKRFLESLNIKNVYNYIKEQGKTFKLKNPMTVTFHKPCNLDNYPDIKWILENTENLNYIEMNDYDKCCGLTGLQNPKEFGILKEVFKEKRNNILSSGAKIVLTACLGCEASLKLFSKNDYKVMDVVGFILKNKI